MDTSEQEELVKKIQEKLDELKSERLKVDEANETLRKKLQTLTSHLDSLDAKYGKTEDEFVQSLQEPKKLQASDINTENESKNQNQVDTNEEQ